MLRYDDHNDDSRPMRKLPDWLRDCSRNRNSHDLSSSNHSLQERHLIYPNIHFFIVNTIINTLHPDDLQSSALG
jgi:hypothetical protein